MKALLLFIKSISNISTLIGINNNNKTFNLSGSTAKKSKFWGKFKFVKITLLYLLDLKKKLILINQEISHLKNLKLLNI